MRLLMIIVLLVTLATPVFAAPASVQMTNSFTLQLKLKAKSGYHINKDAPIKVTLTAIEPSKIVGPTAPITIETPAEKLATCDIKFKPGDKFEPGKYAFKFSIRGVICDNKGENCVIVKTAGTVYINVVKKSAANFVKANIKLDETVKEFKVDACV